ncbi:MAG: tetratricopeptide repeat protein [Thermoflexales bacterium]|nr:tetratricopeptide repeat protein [Thermoflexales bacterium]
MNNTSVSEKVRAQFVGRREALDAFYLRFSYRHMKNGIYYCGGGGLGKTWVLQKIINDNKDDPIRVVTPIIDFFNTQNHSVHGLQARIKSCLPNSEAFRPYDEAINRLEEARSKPETHPSTIASLEARADKAFIECCQEAIVGREVILLFDTFERVQQRYVGRWLCKKFLPKVGDLIVAIAGRPEPTPAQMPDNMVTNELGGLDLEAFTELVHSRLPSAPDEIVDNIWKHTDGAPLMAHLILDLHDRDQFISRLGQLGKNERVQDSPELERWLVGQFEDQKIIWAMAYLRRRFDIPMLQYIVENGEKWFRPADYERIFNDLPQLVYVKEYPQQQSHLLHDEIQCMVAQYVLPDVGIWEEFRAFLYDLVVNRYYPESIRMLEEAPPDKKTAADMDLARQLRAEHLGYILDHDPDAGLEKYESYRAEVEQKTHDYDFEELVWGEVREHLDHFGRKGYDICYERGEWLRRHSLFEKAEELFGQMLDRFQEQRIKISQWVGFMAMRQGNITKAKEMFDQGLAWVGKGDWQSLAMIESNLAQAAIEAGEWDKALEHYARSFRAATLAHDQSQMAAVYLSRGYLYSLKGKYVDAERQCRLALETLEPLPDNETNAQRTIYAWMNLGTVYRHTEEYAEAKSCYEKGLKLAKKNEHRETVCDSLQHLGINEYLRGRVFRRKGESLTEACEHQMQAWQHLVDALEIARESGWRKAIASGLHRLAKVYREIYRLQQLPESVTSDSLKALQALQQKAQTFQHPFEVEFEHILLMSGLFAEMNWLEKAARLFEVSALMADEASDYHCALDGLTELARLFLELEHFDLVPLIIRRIERIKGSDYEEELFTQISQIIIGDGHFEQARYDEALEQYKIHYAQLAKLIGYASYRLNDNLRNLEWRFSILPPELVVLWCDALEDAWLAQSVSAVRPNMLDMLERIRLETLARSASSGSE